MNKLIIEMITFGGLLGYWLLLIAVISFPLWAYKIIEDRILGRHKALRAKGENKARISTSILASIGTTTTGVFLIQVLPLLFSIINDVAGSFAVDTVYAEHISGSGIGDYVDSFYALTAELGGMLQTVAPMAAVGLGGYNLLNNLAKGLPAIKR
jgi:hypothetical protein